MNRPNGGVPDDYYEQGDPDLHLPEYDEQPDPNNPYESDEPLNRQLASFAFIREEDEREVRLYFRDVAADEIAKAFRRSGALLISITGERALSPSPVAANAPSDGAEAELPVDPSSSDAHESRGRKRRHRKGPALRGMHSAQPAGEATLRYFYSMGELVYTVNITTVTGIIHSVAGIFPAALQSERELQTRLALLFREATANTQ
ncbi:MAG: hypothetical protein ABI670_13260 [Chloroflexota bacterium]